MRSWCLVCAATVVAAACGSQQDDDRGPQPNDGLLRDFVDGKFDGDGHPLNARVTTAAALCPELMADDAGVIALGARCDGAIAGGEQHGEMIASVHLRVDDATGTVLALRLSTAAGAELATDVLTVDRVRATGAWTDVALPFSSAGAPLALALEPGAGAEVAIDYVEVFPARFGLVVAPGSGVFAADDNVQIELPIGAEVSRLEVDGADARDALTAALAAGVATRTDTAYRSILDVPVGVLAPARADVAQLRVAAGGNAARIELRQDPAPCVYEGDPTGVPVLITGFQPFPADGWHGNVSGEAVLALRPSAIAGVRVMRLILPVEYDRAAATVRDAIARCAPAVVLSFGQGGGAIALEHTAYNLKDTGEVPGGVPDNRGVIAAAVPIDAAAPPTRTTSLPLDAIDHALRDLGEAPLPSEDPGRYICNNVFFVETGTVDPTGAVGPRRAGFIHLPYTTYFDDSVRARWGAALEAIVGAAIR